MLSEDLDNLKPKVEDRLDIALERHLSSLRNSDKDVSYNLWSARIDDEEIRNNETEKPFA